VGATQQIADWLAKLGMSEYAERFAENGIDVSVLRHLTDQDLKDIGVLLGHRRKMLAAIRKRATGGKVEGRRWRSGYDASDQRAASDHCASSRRVHDGRNSRLQYAA
jgi:SAM (Sterile alpha motif) domain-containing protein